MNFEGSLEWIESAGGPLLLLEEHLLKSWQGVFVRNSSDPESDYDRACTLDDYIGLISVNSGHGIVLGDEPLSTAWMLLSQTNNGLLVRWVFAENEDAVIDALSNLQNPEWETTQIEITIIGNKLFLYDAASDGSQIEERLEIEIPSGRYEIETFHYKPNNQTYLMLHRFNSVL